MLWCWAVHDQPAAAFGSFRVLSSSVSNFYSCFPGDTPRCLGMNLSNIFECKLLDYGNYSYCFSVKSKTGYRQTMYFGLKINEGSMKYYIGDP